jgi:calcium-dependent protein kinase
MSVQSQYDLGARIGSGANGVVRAAVCKRTRQQMACKTIAKVPAAGATVQQVDERRNSIDREVSVMNRLVGCECVVQLEDVYEDADFVHIIMERCRGGELGYKSRHCERTSASQMRAVLRTVAHCHENNILHRDVKPSNFLLLFDSHDAPVKAVDFGLSVPYTPDTPLPLTGLSMEGTPWFMAPETLASHWGPPADVWSTGIMAHQLLTGRLPFDDRSSPHNPRLSTVIKSILNDKLDLSHSAWAGISPQGRDFVAQALARDVDRRPSARDLLAHPWLAQDVPRSASWPT